MPPMAPATNDAMTSAIAARELGVAIAVGARKPAAPGTIDARALGSSEAIEAETIEAETIEAETIEAETIEAETPEGASSASASEEESIAERGLQAACRPANSRRSRPLVAGRATTRRRS
jgi:hypothetical protein